MEDTTDLLKIKIETAKKELSSDTVNAINAVDWRAAILGLRAKKGYTFEQLGDLELETELLLSGLVGPENYPKELETRMKISKADANELVNEMNNLVFKKIREELVKNAERKKIFVRSEKSVESGQEALKSAGIEIVPDLPAVPSVQTMQEGKLELTTIEKPIEKREEILKKIEISEAIHPILAQKLSGPLQMPVAKTEHSLENISKINAPNPAAIVSKTSKIDPYREIPE